MLFLALDTTTERLIVALRSEQPDPVDRWTNIDSQGNHAKELLLAAEDLLEGRTPDVVGVALGPGSFTGVRIGLASAKGLAEGWGVPLVGLDNLSAMALSWQQLVPETPAAVLPVIDARKKKFYGMLCRDNHVLVEPGDLSPEGWVAAVTSVWKGPVVLSGYQGALLAEALGTKPPGWTVLPVHDWAQGLLDQTVEAWDARAFLPPDAGPRYLRLSEAEENLVARPS